MNTAQKIIFLIAIYTWIFGICVDWQSNYVPFLNTTMIVASIAFILFRSKKKRD